MSTLLSTVSFWLIKDWHRDGDCGHQLLTDDWWRGAGDGDQHGRWLLGGGEEEAEENDQPDNKSGKLMCVLYIQASDAVDVLLKYSEQSDFATADDMHLPSLIKHRLDYMRFCSEKQTMISDFFCPRTY